MEEKQMIKKTDRGWVDLSNLIYNGNSVDWDRSIGKTVDFQYDDIVATLMITGRADNIQYVYIDVPGYVAHRRIYVGQIKHGQLGNVVGKITSDFRYEVGDIVDGLSIADRYRASGYKYYNYYCVKDGYEGIAREDHLMCGHGCPVCNNSIGEKCVVKYLTEHEINFMPQYSFSDCIYEKQLHFDFYLPQYNACIEYDGMQHFEPVDFAGRGKDWANAHFKLTVLRDNIKNDYCAQKGIVLCRIKYTQDIKEVLDIFFNNLSKNSKQY